MRLTTCRPDWPRFLSFTKLGYVRERCLHVMVSTSADQKGSSAMQCCHCRFVSSFRRVLAQFYRDEINSIDSVSVLIASDGFGLHMEIVWQPQGGRSCRMVTDCVLPSSFLAERCRWTAAEFYTTLDSPGRNKTHLDGSQLECSPSSRTKRLAVVRCHDARTMAACMQTAWSPKVLGPIPTPVELTMAT